MLGAFCARKLFEDPAPPRFEDVDAVERRRRRMMAALVESWSIMEAEVGVVGEAW